MKKSSRQEGGFFRGAEALMRSVAVLYPRLKQFGMYGAAGIQERGKPELNIGLEDLVRVVCFCGCRQNPTIRIGWQEDLRGSVQSERIGGSWLLLNFRDESTRKKCSLSFGKVARFTRDRDISRHREHLSAFLANSAAVSSKKHLRDQSSKLPQRPHSSDCSRDRSDWLSSARSLCATFWSAT